MKPPARRLVSTAQGLLVGTGVVWLVTLAERNAVVSISEVMPLQFFLAVTVNALALCLMGIRLQLVLRAARLTLPTRTALRLHFQSVFYLFVLPFGVGMEAARYYGIAPYFPAAPRRLLVTVVVADRVAGVSSALGFAAVLASWYYAWNALPVTAVCVAGLGIAAIALARIANLDIRVVLQTTVLSLAVHALALLAVVLVCQSVRLDVSELKVAMSLSLGTLGSIVPTTLAGAGLNDIATAGLLIGLGLPALTAATIAGFAYLGRLMGALVGALLELTGDSLFASLFDKPPSGG